MKKIKKPIRIACLLFGVLLMSLNLFGCKAKDKEKQKEKENVVSEEQDKKEDTNALPNEKQMAKDIDSFGANAIDMNSGTYTLKTSSIEITKAKEETEQYVVYCTATQESDMFKASNDYKMTYNFYDVGGWVLDECVVEKIDMIPKTTIPEEEARHYASGLNNFTSLTHINTEKVSDTKYIFHYVGKYEYNYMDDVYNNDVVCTYDNSYGWYISYLPKGSYHDWSKMYGTWYGENSSTTIKTTINVKEVNESAGTVSFDIHLTRTKGTFGLFQTVQEIKENNIVTTIDIIDLSYLLEQGLEYEGRKSVYSELTPAGTTYKSDFVLEWGKDRGAIRTFIGGEWMEMTKIK